MFDTKACAGTVLATARNAVGMCQYQTAQLLSKWEGKDSISEDTVSNWERNRAMPDPEQVAEMERIYEAPGLWDEWMRMQWPSYRERIPKNPNIASAGMAVINARYQMMDVHKLIDGLVRDLMDGKLDDVESATLFIKESEEAAGALLAAASKLKKEV